MAMAPRNPGTYRASHRLSVQTLEAIVDLSDMELLLAWRRTCHRFSTRVHRILEDLIHAVIAHYIPRPHVFLSLLRQHDAVIVDEGALAFWLRDVRVLGKTLVVSIPGAHFAAYRTLIVRSYALKPTSDEVDNARELPDTLRYRITSTPDRYIVLQRSLQDRTQPGADYATASVAHAPHTGLMNFVGADVFGSLVPALTLRRRAHLAMPWPEIDVAYRIPILRLLAHGEFSFSSEPTELLEPAELQAATEDASLRAAIQCPCVPRYFGGEGSLLDSFDLFGARGSNIVHTGGADGVVPAWRFPAGERCPYHDVLHDGPAHAFLLRRPGNSIRYGPSL